jgi:hypothetical protein
MIAAIKKLQQRLRAREYNGSSSSRSNGGNGGNTSSSTVPLAV